MKKTVTKKLSLMKETLGKLDDGSLGVVAGGSRDSLTEPSCRHCPSTGCTTAAC